MTFKEYNKAAMKTALPGSQNLAYAFAAVAGEAGELNDEWKKVWRDDEGKWTAERLAKVKLELGDLLWELNNLANLLDTSLDKEAGRNIEKLADRHSEGP